MDLVKKYWWVGLVVVAVLYINNQQQNIAAKNAPVGGGTP